MNFMNKLTDQSASRSRSSNSLMLNPQYVPVLGCSASDEELLTWEHVAWRLRMAPDAVQKAGEDEIKHSKSIGFESIEKRYCDWDGGRRGTGKR